jgi:hypothetical protein
VPVVDGVAELVEHRVHPVGVRPYVGEHPHVVGVLAPDRETEGVLVLAVSPVEVALRYDAPHVQAQRVVGSAGELRQVPLPEAAVHVERCVLRGFLEERVRILSHGAEL